MGLEIYPQTLRESLEMINVKIDILLINAGPYISSLKEYIDSESLKGTAYESQKEYLDRGQLSVIRQQINTLEEYKTANEKHIQLIDKYLSGETYVSEDMLKEQIIKSRIIYRQAEKLKLNHICFSMNRIMLNTQERLNALNQFNEESTDIYNTVDFSVSQMEEQVDLLKNTPINPETQAYRLESVFPNYIKKEYIDILPLILKKYLTENDIKKTEDGFFVSTKSIEDLLKDMGLKGSDVIGETKVSDYDDWYLAGVRKNNREFVYTLIKMREPTDSQGAKGSKVSFVELNMESCEDIFKQLEKNGKLSDDEKRKLEKQFYKVTNADENSMVDKTLKEYFPNPKSDGSYLIADCIVSKVAGTATKNTNSKGYTYSIETPYEDNVRQCKKKLDKLEKKGVYNKEKNEINIKDINNLSEDEYDAILIVTTGNPDAYSYAAENQYHADMLDKYGQLWKSHTISSDAGVGESMFANLYESDFKDTDGETYREQKKYHK